MANTETGQPKVEERCQRRVRGERSTFVCNKPIGQSEGRYRFRNLLGETIVWCVSCYERDPDEAARLIKEGAA